MKLALTPAAVLLFSSSVVSAAPSVNGNVISWPDDGWYQVQLDNDDGVIEVCQGGTSCEVSQGTYIVINHTTGERFSDILVSTMPTAGVTVSDMTINWPDNGWYQVQASDTFESICNGTRSCDVPPGNYTVINHTTGERFRDILVGVDVEPITVEGNIISWPDDGWYQVQTSMSYENVCNGGVSCEVLDGTYVVINHSTGERYNNVQVPVNATSSKDIEYTEFARGDLAFTEDLTFRQPRYQVIRNTEDLNTLYFGSLVYSREDVGFIPLPFVNFEESIVVLIAHEIVGSGGYDINIDQLVFESDLLTVQVVKTAPCDNCAVDAAFTGPFKLIQIPVIYENVDFVERVERYSC